MTTIEQMTPEEFQKARERAIKQLQKQSEHKDVRAAKDHEHYLKNKDKIAVQAHERYLEDKDKKAAYDKQRHLTHKEEKVAYDHQHYLDHKDEKAIYNKEYSKKNEAKVKATQKRWRLTHKKEKAIYNQQYVLEHKVEKSIYNHQYGLEHAEEKAIHDKLYHQENPEIWPASHERRRARILGVGGSFTAKEFRELKEAHEFTCVYCGELKTLGPDHVLPISRGGSNNIENILPACKSCNCSKGTKTFEEFLTTLSTEQVDEIQTRIYMANHPEAVAWVRERMEINGDS